MKPPVINTRGGPSPAGDVLRRWRDLRGKSQLDLSLDTGVSQKHISFVESGRSSPSRQMLMDLAQALDMPLRERNVLLVAAGYAPVYPDDALDAQAMRSIDRALQRMLRQHDPFPAVVMDRHWNVIRRNDSAPRFFGCFIDMSAWHGRRNLLQLMFDPAGMRPFIANWPDTARGLLARVQRESIGRVVDAETKALLEDLVRSAGIEAGHIRPVAGDDLPVIPLSFRKDDVTLNYFSMVTTVGTPLTTSAEELRLECMFPADEATEAAHDAFVAAHSSMR